MVIASVGRVRGIRKVGSGLVLSLSLAAAVPACDGKLASSGSLGQVACPAPDHPPAPTCGAALCGNGVRDSCQVCGPAPLSVGCADIGATSSPECGPSMCRAGAVERCDGADLGAATCATLGFGGGTLACSDRCTFQTNGCTTCLVDDRIVACRHTEVDAAAPLTLAMAATDHEVVIAWVTGPGLNGTYDDDAGSVRLARFDTRLSLIAQTGCFGPAHARGAAIARTRSGYILAIQGDGGVTVQALNLALQPTGPARVVPDAAWLTLTAREKNGTSSAGRS